MTKPPASVIRLASWASLPLWSYVNLTAFPPRLLPCQSRGIKLDKKVAYQSTALASPTLAVYSTLLTPFSLFGSIASTLVPSAALITPSSSVITSSKFFSTPPVNPLTKSRIFLLDNRLAKLPVRPLAPGVDAPPIWPPVPPPIEDRREEGWREVWDSSSSSPLPSNKPRACRPGLVNPLRELPLSSISSTRRKAVTAVQPEEVPPAWAR